MFRFILLKLGQFISTLFGVVTIVFFLFQVMPGDPSRMMLDQNENSQQLALLQQKYGFDRPLYLQYVYYLNDLSPISLHHTNSNSYTNYKTEKYHGKNFMQVGNYEIAIKYPYLRNSFQKNGKKVTTIIGETFPNTVILAVFSILIASFLGVILGVISALFKDSWVDRSIQLISILGMSIPSFFSAILLAWIFGYLLHNFTGLPMSGNLYQWDDYGEAYRLHFSHIILPSLALGVRPLAVVVQLMRNSLLEAMQTDYVRTAYAKGLSTLQVVWRHALKNALNPIITALSGWFASMLAGAVFVEFIFGWNGIGKQMVEAINTMDLPIIMGIVIVLSFTFIIINILVDVIYVWLDPRLRK